MTQKINPPAIERITRVDVASVAGTVDLTASVPFIDDIRITGALAITKFTVAVGRVLRVTAGGAFTLTNNANIVTQTGAGIVAAAGDTFMLRATAADTVEVLEYVPAAVASATARGMVTLATDAEAQALSDANKPITPSSLKGAFQSGNQSLAASGYQKLPGGLIMQWGSQSVAASTTSTFSFPLTFPTSVLQFVCGMGSDGPNAPANDSSGGDFISTSQYNIRQGSGVASKTFHWVAFGT